ncbi:MAG: class I SAM-dependent methyltransferase [Oscillospiraceae bacterium]|nr:class I SAM-dependent methyltransferase [Oscillospiraceae bacterium]
MSKKKDFKFDKRADKYDEEFEGKLSEKFYNLVTENVILSDGFNVLDAGCGTGTVLRRLSEKCEINCFEIDVEEKMLAQAHKKCPDMDIRLCSCDKTPFNDGYFDVIVACMAYHHFPDKDKFAAEAARLLKPNGTLYIADPKFPLPVRKLMNTALSIHNVAGEFFSADEISANFAPYGFEKTSTKSNAYTQIVIMSRKAMV